MQHATPTVTAPRGEARESARSLTVLHITAPAPAGGLESVVYSLAAGHRQLGHVVHVLAVVTPEQGEHQLFAGLREQGVVVHSALLPARAYLKERALVATLCRTVRPDIVHTHGYRPDVVDGGLARRQGIATVSTVHGFTYDSGRGSIYEWLQRRALARFDAVVAVSNRQISELQRAGVAHRRIHLIRNAWTPSTRLENAGTARQKLGVADGSFHVGWVGRLSREKGADVLIEALALLPDLESTVSVIGSGNQRVPLEAQAASLGVANRLRWHGLLPAAAALYGAFDVFVLSSRTEGTPIALFEAMAAGVPIVAAAVGGVPDVVSEREAILVPPEKPEALAAAIRAVHSDPGAARERAHAAQRRLASEFAQGPWLERYEDLYRALINHQRSIQ